MSSADGNPYPTAENLSHWNCTTNCNPSKCFREFLLPRPRHLTNLTLINLYAACRGIEWAQTNWNHRALTSYHLNRFGNAYAFTRNDVQCFTFSLPLVLGFAIKNPEMVRKIKLRFEEQKNGGKRRMETVYQERYQSKTLLCNSLYGEAPCNLDKLIVPHAAECL